MLLLIPGPVTTRHEVRAAMAQDIAPWDSNFRPLYREVRERVGALAGNALDSHAVLPLQGCGHFAIEASIRSLVPRGGKMLIPLTGSYAERMARLAREIGHDVVELPTPPGCRVTPASVEVALAADAAISHVGLIYSETSSGVVHDAEAIGRVIRSAGRRMILDAVSAFGALPLDLAAQPEIDAAIFTANKCLEGMPGLGVIVARIEAVIAGAGRAASWSFDLHDIYRHGMREDWSSFRFTPPAAVMAALRTALRLHSAEGGCVARLARYRANAAALFHGMRGIGLEPYLAHEAQGPIVLNVHAPDDRAWSLAGFVQALKARGFLISNFYNTELPSFRVGCIGAITEADMRRFAKAVDSSLTQMGIRQRSPGFSG
jgi:2-aminoethylphosphonate-pyruvate transaminase